MPYAVVADWLDNLPRRIKDPTSVRLVQSYGARIIRELGKIPVRKLEPRQVEKFLRQMAADGLSTSTIQQVTVSWRGRWTAPCGTAWWP